MKIVKLILKILFVISVILFLAIFAVRQYTKRAIPDYNQDIELTGLSAQVEVYRDKYAIPHIYAENEKDLYTAVGYLMAQDRLWQMDLLRRVTLGRLSEIFGENFVETDLLLRSLRYSKKSEELLKTVDKELLNALEAFADGINQFIKSNEKKLPLEFTILGYKPEPWEPLHSLNLIGYMAWDLKSGWNEILMEENIRKVVDSAHYAELIPNASLHKTYIFPDFSADVKKIQPSRNLSQIIEMLTPLGTDVFEASNNWAVSGERSVTGKPLIANDMHLSFSVPGIWYQVHQVVKGGLNVTGVAVPGQPFVVCGHNDTVAWGMTNTDVDNVDFYLEKINPADSGQYLYADQWKQFDLKKEIIKIKGAEEVEKTIMFSHRGPVVSGIKGIKDSVITMHWIGDEPGNEIRSIYLVNRAKNWDDFKEAMRSFKAISQNVVYADVNGNIGLYCCAGVPIRKRDIQVGILPGWTDEYDWKGLVPFEELPYSYNPGNGFVASANNKTVDKNYPYHIGSWHTPPYRMDRINELLNSKEKLSIEDFKTIQLDQKSKLAEMFLPKTIEYLRDVNDFTDLQSKCYSMLKVWDGTMDKEKPEPLIFETYYQNLIRQLFKDELGDEMYNKLKGTSDITRAAIYGIWIRGESAWADDITTNTTETMGDVAAEAFKNTVNELRDKYGEDTDNWKWGDIHQLTFSHPLSSVKILGTIFKLNRGPFRVGGSFHTVSPYSYQTSNFPVPNHGASERHIFSAGNWDESLTVIPTGNSGIPMSKNYMDQTEMYINGEYHEDLFSEEKVKSASVYKMTFLMKKQN